MRRATRPTRWPRTAPAPPLAPHAPLPPAIAGAGLFLAAGVFALTLPAEYKAKYVGWMMAALGAFGSDEAKKKVPEKFLFENLIVPLDLFDDELDHAVRAFQQRRGLIVDGIVGGATYRALKEASYRLGARTLAHQFGAPMYGDDVATLQSRLQDLGFYTALVDGYFGLQTHNALMSYQREYGLAPDGICGP